MTDVGLDAKCPRSVRCEVSAIAEAAVTVRATLPCGSGASRSLCSRVSGTYLIVAGRRTSPEATRPAIRPPRIAASVPATGTAHVSLFTAALMELKTSALHWLVAGVQSKSGFHDALFTTKSWRRNRVVHWHPRWSATYRGGGLLRTKSKQ